MRPAPLVEDFVEELLALTAALDTAGDGDLARVFDAAAGVLLAAGVLAADEAGTDDAPLISPWTVALNSPVMAVRLFQV